MTIVLSFIAHQGPERRKNDAFSATLWGKFHCVFSRTWRGASEMHGWAGPGVRPQKIRSRPHHPIINAQKSGMAIEGGEGLDIGSRHPGLRADTQDLGEQRRAPRFI